MDSGIIKRGVIHPSGSPLSYLGAEDISEKVHNVYLPAGNILSYYDSNFSGIQSELTFPISIPVISLIRINVTVDPNPIDVSSRINFSSSVNIRNL